GNLDPPAAGVLPHSATVVPPKRRCHMNRKDTSLGGQFAERKRFGEAVVQEFAHRASQESVISVLKDQVSSPANCSAWTSPGGWKTTVSGPHERTRPPYSSRY